MGLVGNVIEFLRATVDDRFVPEVKLDTGGDDPLTAENYSPVGDDGPPLQGDVVIVERIPGTKRYSVIGYIDVVNEGVALGGEKRWYSRDENGAIVSTIYMKRDGSVNIGEDNAATEIPRDDSLQQQLTDLKAAVDDLQDAHDNHIHVTSAVDGGGGSVGVIETPLKVTTVSYNVGKTKSQKGRVT